MEKKVRPTSEYVLKKCCKRENYLDELISKLPDEILVSIVSRLTIKEAARTSILSHRWKNLWTFTTGSLNFDASKTMWEIQLMRLKEVEKVYEKERSRYISWVNQVLTQHQASNIDEFRVSFDLNKDFKCDIDRWINIAMTKRVQRLEIDLTSFVWNWYEASKHYTFPQELYVHMKNPQDLSCTRSLTSLCLKYVNVSEELLEYFLFNCPLERLSLAYSEDLVNLKVAGSSLQLTFLDIFRCASLKNVVICAPNLLSFNYFGQKIRLHIENAPLLVDVSFGGGDFDPVLYAFCPLSTYLSQLETLKLQMVPEEIMQFPQFLKFANLRHLTLRVTAKGHESLLGLTSLLNAAPQLHRFTLQLHFLRSRIQIRARNYTKRPLPCLKVVELVGFVGRRIDVELAMYLFEYAVMLEKIIIDPRNLYFLGQPWENEETKERKAGRKRAQQLAAVVPRGAKLVIL